MRRIPIIALVLFVITCAFTFKMRSGKDVLQKMYKTYNGKWYSTFTFTQTTDNYRNDSLIKTTTWYEWIAFPDNFRISFGDIKDGNALIQKRDSAYNFRNGKLFRKNLKGQDLTFMLGGMYFMPFDSVLVKMKKEGYDVNKFHETEWKGKAAYVVGSSSPGEKTNQLWIDKQKLVVIRFIKYDKDRKEEGVFGDHQKFGKAWSETSCDFYVNDKLVQKEVYKDCKFNTAIDMALFDPYNFKY